MGGIITFIGSLIGPWVLKKAAWGFSVAAGWALAAYLISKIVIGVALTAFELPPVPQEVACAMIMLDFPTCASAIVAAATWRMRWNTLKFVRGLGL